MIGAGGLSTVPIIVSWLAEYLVEDRLGSVFPTRVFNVFTGFANVIAYLTDLLLIF